MMPLSSKAEANKLPEIVEFVRKIRAGELEKELASQSAEEAKLSDTELNILTGAVMQSEVFDQGKRSACIRIFAKWCKFCTMSAPTWKGIAWELMEEYPGLVMIGDIDGTLNEFSKKVIQVKGYPSAFCYNAPEKKIIPLQNVAGKD